MKLNDASMLTARLEASPRAIRTLAPGTVRLDNGDPDFNTPAPIREAHAAALAAGDVHYAHPQGTAALRGALAAQVRSLAGRPYGPEQIVVTHGATGALTAAILATVDPGDRVILPEPTYSLYADLVLMAGGRPVYVPTERPSFHLDIDAIAEAAPGARLLIVCNPCNPTGAVYTREELLAVAKLARKQDLLLIADEAYDHIVYEPARFTSFLELADAAEQLVYVQSFSKTYAMTGWRLGYLAAPAWLATACARVHRTLNGPVNSAVQAAALAALSLDGAWSRKMLAEYAERRGLMMDAFRQSGTEIRPPEGTFYAFVPHSAAVTSERMADLAAAGGVAVRPGTEYGPSGEGFVRVAFSAAREDLAVGLQRLAAAMAATGKNQGPRPASAVKEQMG
jgi:aspartate/methionine/tyrosine aminotransferase